MVRAVGVIFTCVVAAGAVDVVYSVTDGLNDGLNRSVRQEVASAPANAHTTSLLRSGLEPEPRGVPELVAHGPWP